MCFLKFWFPVLHIQAYFTSYIISTKYHKICLNSYGPKYYTNPCKKIFFLSKETLKTTKPVVGYFPFLLLFIPDFARAKWVAVMFSKLVRKIVVSVG